MILSRYSLAVPALSLASLLLLSLLPAPAIAQDDGTPPAPMPHSPWLALRFEQNGAYVPLYELDTLKSEVTLKQRPFTIVMPVRSGDDTYWIAAWDADTIFSDAKPKERAGRANEIGPPPYFSDGTGMADTAAGSGTLFLNNRGHHHLFGLRLGPERDRHVFNISSLFKRSSDGKIARTLINDRSKPLYFVAWYDENGDEVMQHGEYEFLVVRFR